MIEITKEQSIKEQQNGTGVLHFMGGLSSTNGKMILIVGNKIFLFQEKDATINNNDWNRLIQQMNNDADSYIKSLSRNG